MAVSIIQRPLGFIQTGNTGNGVFNESGGVPGALNISSPAFGLSDNHIVYLKSEIGEYNGFRLTENADANNFRVRDITGGYVPFIPGTAGKSALFTAFNLSHSWNCVHLPIKYKLSNTLWPTNSDDTVRTISSVTNSNGYCAMSLSGDIKATGSAAALEFVKITLATDDDLNEVWQIISYTNDTTFTLNIPYSTANDTSLTGASIQYYYNNYNVKVQVWGGLNNAHQFYGQEPYELLATLDIVPDEENICEFSISEILKRNVAIKNNLLLGTLPNNLDAFTMFFIKYAEVYDDSDGTTLTQTTPSYTSDLTTFEGKAVNSKLPFKNVHSGSMSEYVMESSMLGTFLTNFTRPTIFDGKYFDLSFLWDGVKTIFFIKEWYINNVLQDVTGDTLDAFYTGVYRGVVEADCDYDRIDVTAYKVTDPNSSVGLITPNSWTALTTGGAVDFDTRNSEYFELSELGAPFPTRQAYQALTAGIGSTLTFYVRIVVTNYTSGTIAVNFFLNTSAAIAGAEGVGFEYTANGEYFEKVSITSTQANQFLILQSSPPAVVNVKIYLLEEVSETKTIDINCDCTPSKATTYHLSWLNNLGGFDHWLFTAYADDIIDITDSGETEENIFPNWPDSYGEFADTIRKQTFRESRYQALVRSQHLTEAQLTAIKNIKTSPLVQIVNSIYDRRTVIVDTDSITWKKEGSNLFEISFTITYTDDVPSQSV